MMVQNQKAMPKITQVNQIEVSPEKFLKSCTKEELIETELLLSSPYYQQLMQEESGELVNMQLPLNQ